MRRLITAGLIGAFIIPSVVWAAGAGNPAAIVGQENYGITFEVEEQVKRLDTDLARSRRYLGKVIWGVTDKLDLYAKLGASALDVAVEGFPDFKGSEGMTWGGGGRYVLVEAAKPHLRAFVDLQMLAFKSKGEVLVPRMSPPNDYWTDKYVNTYKWNEIQLSLYAAWVHTRFSPYIGFGVTNVFGDVDKKLYRVAGYAETFQERQSNDFREDGIPEFILGIDIDLGGTGRASGEIRLSDTDDVSFFIGVSELLF